MKSMLWKAAMSPGYFRWYGYGLIAIGGGILAPALYYCLLSLAGPALQVSATEIEIADGVPGNAQELSIYVHNKSAAPIRILGFTVC